jgi:hypothetical protein
MLRAYSNIQLFDPDSNLSAWLITILRNEFYSEPFLNFYRLALLPVAKPTALLLDWWLGKEGIAWLRERDVRSLILRSAHERWRYRAPGSHRGAQLSRSRRHTRRRGRRAGRRPDLLGPCCGIS